MTLIEQSDFLTIRPGLVNSASSAPTRPRWTISQDQQRAVRALVDHGSDLALRDQDRDATPRDHAVVYAGKGMVPVVDSRGASVKDGMQVALTGVSGRFEEYAKLPSRRRY